MVQFNETTWRKGKKVKEIHHFILVFFFFHKEKEEMQIIPRLSLGDQYNKIIWNKTEKV